MKPFVRFLAATFCLMALAAAVVYHLGGKQVEYRAETTIRNTSVQNVMDHLSKPELVKKWAFGLADMELESGSDAAVGSKAKLTFVDKDGSIEMENQFLFGSDNSLTVKTSNEHVDVFSTWQVIQQDRDVVVRQLMLGTHKGLGRFEGLFNKQSNLARMKQDLDRLKSFIETGELPNENLSEVDSPVESAETKTPDTSGADEEVSDNP